MERKDSSHSAQTGKDESDHASEDQGAPEALIRKETQQVLLARLLAGVVLVIAAVVTVVLVYVFTHGLEVDSYESSFNAVASRVVDSLGIDTNLKFAMSKSLAISVKHAIALSGASHLNFTMDPSVFSSLSEEALFKAQVIFSSWNPMLRTDDERRQFEAFAEPQVFRNGPFEQCLVCESEDFMYKDEGFVPFPGFSPVRCITVDLATRTGGLPEARCDLTRNFAADYCECVPVPDGISLPTPIANKPDQVFRSVNGTNQPVPYGNPPYHPFWQTAILNAIQPPFMYDHLADPVRRNAIEIMNQDKIQVLSEMFVREGLLYENYGGSVGDVSAIFYYPVLDANNEEMVGSIALEVMMSTYSFSVFPEEADKVDVVIENSCGQNFTFGVDPTSNTMQFIGPVDLHDRDYSDLSVSSTYEEFEYYITSALPAPEENFRETSDFCRYKFHVFSTREFQDTYVTNKPTIYASLAGVIFVFTAAVFVLYDVLVRRRQTKIMHSAKQTNDLVTSLFPSEIRDRLLARNEGANGAIRHSKGQLTDFILSGNLQDSEPIADTFASTTVMFFDNANFTAWSSERHPTQVFQLLEAIYSSFDGIAETMGVFKVETVGDSYMAVCGLPKPRRNHAVIMVKFAKQCLSAMLRVTRDLEISLGPSTGDLRARIGLHSGPVTAGVVRGQKARFQLFGDTVNTAARMESHGKPHRIHATRATADLLTAAGKGHWVNENSEQLRVKGKGVMESFWIAPKSGGSNNGDSEVGSMASGLDDQLLDKENGENAALVARDKFDRLVAWNTEVLAGLLESVVSSRKSNGPRSSSTDAQIKGYEQQIMNSSSIVVDEAVQVIPMPAFDSAQCVQQSSNEAVLSHSVKHQLYQFVEVIARSYKDVPFHNFEHSAHVTMSATKAMHRIMKPDNIEYEGQAAEIMERIHSSTYGISSNHLLPFAAAFSVLIRKYMVCCPPHNTILTRIQLDDAEHTGLTNVELSKDNPELSKRYDGRTVAEQNSVDIAWAYLMGDEFKDLRACIYTTPEELSEFRQLVVNAVIATDIADKGLKSLREERWDLAFSQEGLLRPQNNDRRATVVFEYIIQASDIAHTMQHWETYQKFNRRLYEERYLAWINGHAPKDPTDGWYGGELWFFDNYIIPLANKLKACGVFGVTYDEFHTYAHENREEWKQKGQHIVLQWAKECADKYAKEEARPSKNANAA